jgi:hypothetical protein
MNYSVLGKGAVGKGAVGKGAVEKGTGTFFCGDGGLLFSNAEKGASPFNNRKFLAGMGTAGMGTGTFFSDNGETLMSNSEKGASPLAMQGPERLGIFLCPCFRR